MGKTSNDIKPLNVKMGEFPFPLTNGPEESRYLTWLRNHSNYMLENGLTDYLRILAVLVRGIFLNFLILLPYFLVFGAFMSALHLSVSIPTHITFEIDAPASAKETDAPQAGLAGPKLRITGISNFGETRSATFPVDLTEDGIKGSIEAAVTQIQQTDAFPDLDWAPLSRSIKITRRDDEAVYLQPSALLAAPPDGAALTLYYSDRSPLPFSGYLLLAATLIVLFYPIVVRMSQVRTYRSARQTGHFSSVKRRDWYERAFGTLLLVMVGAALIEGFPLLTAYFHSVRQGDVAIAVPTIASMVAGIVAANQVLPMLGGLAKRVGIVLVGAFGLMIPLLVVLFVVEFLVYTDKHEHVVTIWDERIYYALMIPPALFTALLFVTWLIGFGSFRLRGHLQILGLLLVMALLLGAVMLGTEFVRDHASDYLYVYFVVVLALEIMVYCWLAVDVNQTSINGLYRDRLASAYLIGADTGGDIDIEQDINLAEMCNYDAGSTAPYHLVNVALNLQATSDIGIRDRNSDFFVLSKRFIGSDRTGYCRSENMEAVFSQMDLGTAMAISAAAAAPNMGQATNPLMVAFLTLLNIRLGFWVPHPDRLEQYLRRRNYTSGRAAYLRFDEIVFRTELSEIVKRRRVQYGSDEVRPLAKILDHPDQDPEWAAMNTKPTVGHNLVGLAFSGGGIRSATINLGIVQELHRRGVFDHVDYMSSVSGGGYLAASISTLMRHKVPPYASFDGQVSLPRKGKPTAVIAGARYERAVERRFQPWAQLAGDVQNGALVKAGQPLLKRLGPAGKDRLISLMDSFSWRVRPAALMREMLSRLDENHNWVNLSDGGHIENLATIELLRRRCKLIIVGDGEADPQMHFAGLATLIRYARIDLGIDIDINVDPIRLRRRMNQSRSHFAVGRITYPLDEKNGVMTRETGYLVYLKSSFTGDEDEVIKEYRDRNPTFPHETTADQLFDEGQFEAYRDLGEHIAKSALPKETFATRQLSYHELESWARKACPDGSPHRAPQEPPES